MPWCQQRPRRLRGAVLAAVSAALLASGCLPDQLDGRQEGADSDPALALSWAEETSATGILDAGLVAMAEIGSVRLRQDARSAAAQGQVLSKDLLIATGAGIGGAVDGDCTGTLQLPSWGEPAELVVRDDLGAFRGGVSFWESFGEGLDAVPDGVRDVLVEQFADTWTTTPGLARLCELGDFLAPVADLVAGDADAEARRAGLGDVDGAPAARVVAAGASETVTTWVQVAEPHLILRVDVERRDGSEADADTTSRTVTTFSDTDSAVDVEFPASEDLTAFVLPTAATPATPATAATAATTAGPSAVADAVTDG